MGRKAKKGGDDVVMASVPLSRTTHGRVAWLAAHHGKDRSEILAEIIDAAVVGIVCRDDRKDKAGGAGQAGAA